jgi:hypothetical protein
MLQAARLQGSRLQGCRQQGCRLEGRARSCPAGERGACFKMVLLPQRLRSRAAGGGGTSTTVPEEKGPIAPLSIQVVPSPFADPDGVGRWGLGVEAVCGHEQELHPTPKILQEATSPLHPAFEIRRRERQAGRPRNLWDVLLMQRPLS